MNETIFSNEKMTVKQFCNMVGADNFDVYPRLNQDGTFMMRKNAKTGVTGKVWYFQAGDAFGYVPQELGRKFDEGEAVGELFITSATIDPARGPMFMLCESRRKSVFHYALD